MKRKKEMYSRKGKEKKKKSKRKGKTGLTSRGPKHLLARVRPSEGPPGGT